MAMPNPKREHLDPNTDGVDIPVDPDLYDATEIELFWKPHTETLEDKIKTTEETAAESDKGARVLMQELIQANQTSRDIVQRWL